MKHDGGGCTVSNFEGRSLKRAASPMGQLGVRDVAVSELSHSVLSSLCLYFCLKMVY